MKVVLKKKEDKKKVWFLAALGVIALWLLYTNVLSDSSSSTPSASGTAASPARPLDASTPVNIRRRGVTSQREFTPTLGSRRPEDRVDPAKVDPTLRLDLLAKVQNVPLEGGSRNLFQFGVAAPPPDTTPLPKVGKIAIKNPVAVVAAPPPMPTGPPPVPPPPAIPLKYYGYSNARGESRKKAFFLDGDDIIVAWEGDMVKNRYKVVHVGVNSVEMEDTQFKNKQTLPLAEEAIG